MSKNKERRMSQNDHAEGNNAPVQTNDATTATAVLEESQTATELTGSENLEAINPETVDEFPDTAAEAAKDLEDLKEAIATAPESEKSALEVRIEEMEKKIRTIVEGKSVKSKRVASGSRPRTNVKYVLLARPPKWDGAPQVDQLLNILFDKSVVEAHKDPETGKIELTEPELFSLIEDGHKAGLLTTRQPPVRIFQYYRHDLIEANALRMT